MNNNITILYKKEMINRKKCDSKTFSLFVNGMGQEIELSVSMRS